MRRANLARFCGDDASRLRPACVQTGRGDGGQYLKMWQIHARAEAPRQRLEVWEPRPVPAGRSNWIWLRTGSVYGTLVNHFPTHARFKCGTDGAKDFVLVKKCRLQPTDVRSATAVSSGLHPGNRHSLSPEKESPGTWESYPIQYQSNLPVVGIEVRGAIVVRGRESRLHGEGHQPGAIEP